MKLIFIRWIIVLLFWFHFTFCTISIWIFLRCKSTIWSCFSTTRLAIDTRKILLRFSSFAIHLVIVLVSTSKIRLLGIFDCNFWCAALNFVVVKIYPLIRNVVALFLFFLFLATIQMLSNKGLGKFIFCNCWRKKFVDTFCQKLFFKNSSHTRPFCWILGEHICQQPFQVAAVVVWNFWIAPSQDFQNEAFHTVCVKGMS